MSDRNHPTIPQIVQALVTLEDRQNAELERVRDQYLERLREIDAKAAAPFGAMPVFEEGEYAHIEYTLLNPVADGGYISNMVDMARSRESLIVKLRELISSKYVFSVHVRRYKKGDGSGEPEGHDRETDALAKAQGKAYTAEKALEALANAHHELEQKHVALQQEFDRSYANQEDRYEAQGRVVQELFDRIARAWTQSQKANERCTYPEPLDIMNYLAGVGNRPTEKWVNDLMAKYLKQVRQERKDAATKES